MERVLVLAFAVMSVLAFAPAALGDGLSPGLWRAWLTCPGGELPFVIDLRRDADRWSASIRNGPERIDVPEVTLEGDRLTLGFPHYDAKIVATVSGDGRALAGEWSCRSGPERVTTMPFAAEPALPRSTPRFAVPPGWRADGARAQLVGGRWRVDFASDDDPSVGVFEIVQASAVWGTFLTTTGDYRYLEGDVITGSDEGTPTSRAVTTRLRLSVFDGTHAFLFLADLQSDGTLKGHFWSADRWHDTWTGELDPDARLPDPFALSGVNKDASVDRLAFKDPAGATRTIAELRAGRPAIIELFGTWCPNCADAGTLLGEIARREEGRGLAVIGLAFEMSDDHERNARQVELFRARHKADYPILIAGRSAKSEASALVPVLDKVRAYPTFLFVDADGRVERVFVGFSGPATGPAYDKLRRDFQRAIDELIRPLVPIDVPVRDMDGPRR